MNLNLRIGLGKKCNLSGFERVCGLSISEIVDLLGSPGFTENSLRENVESAVVV